jgi:hypothetical protein
LSETLVTDRGVLYYAVGEKYVREAISSAESLRRWMPKIATAIVTCGDIKAIAGSGVLDTVIQIDDAGFSFRDVKGLHRSPFERTIFLDTDTFVCGSLEDLFAILDHFDLAVAHDSVRLSPQLDAPHVPYQPAGVPSAFPEMNTGVVAYRNSVRVQAFFEEWRRLYCEQIASTTRPYHDQPAFTQALYRSDLRYATLTHEYNCRFNSGGHLASAVRILHGRHSDMDQVATELNATVGLRLFWYNRGSLFIHPAPNKIRTLLRLLRPDRMGALIRRHRDRYQS